METSRGVWAMVACLVHEFAAEAPMVAERRLEAAIDRDPGCEDVILWKEVVGATLEFFRSEPRRGERLH
jgi:hypothetical protein